MGMLLFFAQMTAAFSQEVLSIPVNYILLGLQLIKSGGIPQIHVLQTSVWHRNQMCSGVEKKKKKKGQNSTAQYLPDNKEE